MHTYYDILGISVKATQEEILRAYREKIIKAHPDRGGKAEDFIKIRKSYEILSDSYMRFKYNQWIIKNNRYYWGNLLKEFTVKICKDKNLESKIISILDINDGLYLELNGKPSEAGAAKAIKSCLMIIQKNNPECYKQCLELNAICNDIILTHRPFSPKTQFAFKEKAFKFILYFAFILIIICFSVFITEISSMEKESVSHGDDHKLVEEVSSQPGYKETIFQTGDIPYSSHFGNGEYDDKSLSKLIIENFSDKSAVVLLETVDNIVIRNIFIQHGDSFTMKHIPNSKCIIKVMFGNSWNSSKNNGEYFPNGGFMKNISYMQSRHDDLFDFTPIIHTDRVEYPTYSITLHTVKNGNLRTQSIDEEEFFK